MKRATASDTGSVWQLSGSSGLVPKYRWSIHVPHGQAVAHEVEHLRRQQIGSLISPESDETTHLPHLRSQNLIRVGSHIVSESSVCDAKTLQCCMQILLVLADQSGAVSVVGGHGSRDEEIQRAEHNSSQSAK